MTQDAGQLPSHTGREPTLGALDNDPMQPIASSLCLTTIDETHEGLRLSPPPHFSPGI